MSALCEKIHQDSLHPVNIPILCYFIYKQCWKLESVPKKIITLSFQHSNAYLCFHSISQGDLSYSAKTKNY